METNQLIQMDYDVVYEINGQKIIQTKRRVITDGEYQAVLMVYDPKFTKTERQELIGKMYPRFGNYEAFLPAYGLIVWMHDKERFDQLVETISNES